MENCISFNNGNTSSFCISVNREQDYRTIGNNKRIKGVVKVKKFQAQYDDSNGNGIIEPNEYGTVITNNKVKVKAKTIKKRWWGGWWRYRVSEIKAAIDGEAYVGDCGSNNTITFDKNVNYKEYGGYGYHLRETIEIFETYPEQDNWFYLDMEFGFGMYLPTKFALFQPYLYYNKSFHNLWQGTIKIKGIKHRPYTEINGTFEQSGNYVGFGLNIYPKKFWK